MNCALVAVGDGAIGRKEGTLLPVTFHVDTTTLASGDTTYHLSLC